MQPEHTGLLVNPNPAPVGVQGTGQRGSGPERVYVFCGKRGRWHIYLYFAGLLSWQLRYRHCWFMTLEALQTWLRSQFPAIQSHVSLQVALYGAQGGQS